MSRYFLANSAILSSFVEMCFEILVLAIGLPSSSLPRLALPSAGSLGYDFPSFIGTTARSDFYVPLPPASVFPRSAVPFREAHRSPRFLGDRFVYMPCS